MHDKMQTSLVLLLISGVGIKEEEIIIIIFFLEFQIYHH